MNRAYQIDKFRLERKLRMYDIPLPCSAFPLSLSTASSFSLSRVSLYGSFGAACLEDLFFLFWWHLKMQRQLLFLFWAYHFRYIWFVLRQLKDGVCRELHSSAASGHCVCLVLSEHVWIYYLNLTHLDLKPIEFYLADASSCVLWLEM